MHRREASPITRIITGLVLIGLGILFMLERSDVIRFHTIAHFWPLAMVVVGIGRLFSWQTRPIGFSLMMILTGFWFLAITNNWYGLTWHTGWPVIIVIVGIAVIAEALTYRAVAAQPERGDEDA